MSNETFFRMLSIALLGAVALAFVPNTQADTQAKTRADIQVVAQATGEAPIVFVSDAEPISLEIESLQQIEDINAGRFNPAVAGDIGQIGTAGGFQTSEVSTLAGF